MRCSHISLHLGKQSCMITMVYVLQLRNHAWDLLFGSITVLRVVAVAHIIEVVLQFLVSCLAVDVWHSCRFDAFTCILLIHILKRILVEVYRCWP